VARRRAAGRGRIAAGAAGPPGDAAARLLATAPQRFTAARESLARELADRGDAPGALAVRKLRRPVGLSWVLNRVAQERPDEIVALLAAGDRLRVGQRRALAGQGAAELRAAEGALRGAARALRGRARDVLEQEGRPPDPAALARVELLLRVAATAPGDARAALRTGSLLREPEVAAGDLSGLGLVAGGGTAEAARAARADVPGASRRTRPPPGPERGADSGRRSVRTEAGDDSAPSAREQRAERKARERAERAMRERAERQARLRAREIGAARERLERAEKAAGAARKAADAAVRRAQEARGRAEHAEEEAAVRRRELEALERGG
jgi:hypothetical protein